LLRLAFQLALDVNILCSKSRNLLHNQKTMTDSQSPLEPPGDSAEPPHHGDPGDPQNDTVTPAAKRAEKPSAAKPAENRVVKLLEKNPLGMTLPEMAGGPRQLKKIRTLRPMLAEAIRNGVVMPISQRAGHTVYRLVKHLGHR
jgi:hypothetical protein